MSLVGRQIGRYRILEQLGQGGMSVVYKGVDTTLDREVAVKVLHPHLAGRLESRKRLEREAQAVARLRHPNILEVFDFSAEDAAEAYLVTEYIRGETLREFLSKQALQPPEVAAMVVYALSGALAHAHDAGVLHRDLKPENVMLREDGTLKLMDFGIAKILDRDEKMTMTGALVGSPAHMAPEIIEGEEAGTSADVFSLGTMLYLFATGSLPFSGPNTTATLRRILDGLYTDPRQLMPTVSDELAQIIARCLQRAPGDRFADAGELRDALSELLTGLGLDRPHEELTRFFQDPKAYRKELVPRLADALIARAEGLVADRKVARAMGALNQALGLDPRHPRGLLLLDQLQARGRRDRRNRRLRNTALGLGGGFIVVMSGLAGLEVATRPADYQLPSDLAPTDVTLGHVDWPRRPAPPPTAGPPADAPEPAATASATPTPARRGPELVNVVVVVRPFGFLQVDGGPRSADALARHALRLPAGPHRFTVTCDACDPKGRTTEWTVAAGQEVPLIAPLQPSLVSFAGFPDEARVRVGATERTVAEAKQQPFRVVTPPAGSTKMQHLVEYEISSGGEVLAKGSRWIEPGKATLIDRGAP
jgi:serine/threonine-protein kinase